MLFVRDVLPERISRANIYSVEPGTHPFRPVTPREPIPTWIRISSFEKELHSIGYIESHYHYCDKECGHTYEIDYHQCKKSFAINL